MSIVPEEQERLVGFVKSGKGLYIEGTNAVAGNAQGELMSVLGCSLAGQGDYYQENGNVENVTGVPGTIGAGFSFGYLHKKAPDNYVDELAAIRGADDTGSLGGLSSAAIFQSQDGKARAICHAGPNGRYRTITSAIIFSALRGSNDDLQKLAAAYVSFLSPAKTGWKRGTFVERVR